MYSGLGDYLDFEMVVGSQDKSLSDRLRFPNGHIKTL